MYLPDNLPNQNVLITVKTYPLPSSKYEELVCTAGLLPDGKWIRIYPIPFRGLAYDQQYKKYQWIRLNLKRNTSDFRPESYRPNRGGDEPITILDKIGTEKDWALRKSFVFKEVFDSMDDIIHRAKSEERKSLATLKPKEIVDFVVEESHREWKKKWRDQFLQLNMFDTNPSQRREIIKKLPYKYYYKFFTKGDSTPRKMMIEDWEIGALYWNCLKISGGDEQTANLKVKEKYFDEFVGKKDLHLFLGTTKRYHNFGKNPFMIIGVFYPPKVPAEQISMF